MKKYFGICVVCTICFTFTGISYGLIINDSDQLYVGAGESYTLYGQNTYNQSVEIYGTLYLTDYQGSDSDGTLTLEAPTITIDGEINANGKGFRGGVNYSSLQAGEGPGRAVDGAGGGYGGLGGNSGHGGIGGSSYGTISASDIYMGSGGGHANGYSSSTVSGGDGGGCISLLGDFISVSGIITANGQNGDNYGWGAGGGSGGGILLSAEDILIDGYLSSLGGDGGAGTWSGGGGSGGRIKLFYSNSLDISFGDFSLDGGNGGDTSYMYKGGDGEFGTFFVPEPATLSLLALGGLALRRRKA